MNGCVNEVVIGSTSASVPSRSGTSKRIVVPTPGVESIVTLPPMSAARRWQMVRPSPVPPNSRCVWASAWPNAWNRRSCCSGAHADAGVAHGDHDPLHVDRIVAVDDPRSDLHAAHLGELHGVRDEVRDDLADAQRVADVRRADGLVHIPREQQPARGGRVHERVGRGAHDGAQIERRRCQLEALGLDLGEVEHVADDLQQGAGRALGRRDHAALVARELRWGQDLEHARHADHRRAQLVRHRGQEPALGLAGTLSSLPRGHGLLLGLGAGGDIGLDGRRHLVERPGELLEVGDGRDLDSFAVVAGRDPPGGREEPRERPQRDPRQEQHREHTTIPIRPTIAICTSARRWLAAAASFTSRAVRASTSCVKRRMARMILPFCARYSRSTSFAYSSATSCG